MSNNLKLPPGWARAGLAEIVKPRLERISPSSMPMARYVGLENVQAGTNKILTTVPASEMASSSFRFEAGDVLYGKMRPYLNKVVRPRFNGLASAEFIVLPENEAVNGEFLLNRISCGDFVKFACSQYAGDRPRVKFEQLSTFSIDLPPFAEQQRIVAKIEELFSDLEAGVSELKAAKIKLVVYRQALLKAALDGTLTENWRNQRIENGVDDETSSQLLEKILAERRNRWETKQLARYSAQGKKPPSGWQGKYPSPAEPEKYDLPRLVEGWVWASLDMLGEIASGVAKGTKRATEVAIREVPYLRVANVQRGFLELSEVKTILASERDIAELTLKKGDVLFNEGGDRDKLGRGWVWNDEVPNCIHQNHVFRMRPYLPETLPELVSHHGNTFGKSWFQNFGKQTTNLASVNLTTLRMFPVPVPPAAEQIEILSLLNLHLETLNREEQTVDKVLRQLAAQRENIRRAAFSGMLVAQDARDEAAGVTLKRLHARHITQQPERSPTVVNVGRKKMQLVSVSKLRSWIVGRKEKSFTFDDAIEAFPLQYDILKDALFELLAEETPMVVQKFSVKEQTVRFERV